jgi:hypothetical protein
VELSKIFINNVVKLHGVPTSIVSDRDPRFTSKFWKSFWSQLGTKLKFSTAFHPQSDGQTERANRTLEEGLRHYVSTNQNDWDEFLPLLEFCVNNSQSSSSHHTPFYLNYGDHPRLPIDNIIPDSNVEEVQSTLDKLRTTLESAKNHLLRSQQQQSKSANRKRRDFVFCVGEKVWLSTKNIKFVTQGPTTKLNPKFIGPFEIIEKIGAVAYKLKLSHEMLRNKIHPVFHISLLKSHIESNKFTNRQPPRPPPELITEEGEEKFEVEKLLRKRNFRSKIEYLVKWKGYPNHESTWEPESTLISDCPVLINEFNSNAKSANQKEKMKRKQSRNVC